MITLKFKKTFDGEIIDIKSLVDVLNEKIDELTFEMIGNELLIHSDYFSFYGSVREWKK